ncbi:MAG: hypothetical protein ACE5IJ_03825 [Thermoplasmata archaeon]
MYRRGIGFTRFCRFAHRLLGHLRCRTVSRTSPDWRVRSREKSRLRSGLGSILEMVAVDRKQLEDDILFAGLGLRPEEAVSGGRLALILSLTPTLTLVFAHGNPILIVIALILPLIVQRTVVSYPAVLALAVKKASFREAPEVTSHLICGAGEALSHESAVLAVARNSAGSLRTGFQRMIWLVYTKGRNLPEEFGTYAHKWRGRNKGFGEAMLRLSGIMEGRGEDDLGSLLSPVHGHTRRKLRGFLSSLRAPINVVFALGIVLPVMIASILPMSSLAITDSMNLSSDRTVPGNGLHPGLIAVMLDVIFPLAMFLYCREVLSRRPFFSLSAHPLTLSDLSGPLFACALALPIFLAGTLLWNHYGNPHVSLAVLALTSVAIAVSLLLVRHKSEGGSQKLREEFPEAAEYVGNFLLAGEPLETALFKTAAKMEGTETARRFMDSLFLLSMGASDIGQILVRDLMTRGELDVAASLRMIVDIAQKDSVLAGEIAKRISSNLREMSRIEKDARDEIRPIVQTVNHTTTFFSPLVLGVTASMFLLMETYFSQSGGLTSFSFILILGVLLYCNLAVANYFAEGLQAGDHRRLLKTIGNGMLLSTFMFSLSFLASSSLFGVL